MNFCFLFESASASSVVIVQEHEVKEEVAVGSQGSAADVTEAEIMSNIEEFCTQIALLAPIDQGGAGESSGSGVSGVSGASSGVNSVDEEVYAMTAMVGTPLYMAPEQFQTPDYSYPVDVWAYGITLVRLFTLKWPYMENNVVRLVVGVARGELRPIEVKLSDVPDNDVLAVINDCLRYDSSMRPSFKEIEKRLSEALKRCREIERDED